MGARGLPFECLQRMVIGRQHVGSTKTLQLAIVGLAMDKVIGELRRSLGMMVCPFLNLHASFEESADTGPRSA